MKTIEDSDSNIGQMMRQLTTDQKFTWISGEKKRWHLCCLARTIMIFQLLYFWVVSISRTNVSFFRGVEDHWISMKIQANSVTKIKRKKKELWRNISVASWCWCCCPYMLIPKGWFSLATEAEAKAEEKGNISFFFCFCFCLCWAVFSSG